MKNLSAAIALLCAAATAAVAQHNPPPDTILFVNGYVLAATVTDTSGDKITFEKPHSKKHKKISVDRDGVFSIRSGATGREDLIYTYDTLVGNDYTIADARLFIAGEQDAQKGYKARGAGIAAFVLGTASGITGASLFVFFPPFIFSGVMDYMAIHGTHKSITHPGDEKSDAYLDGYSRVASRKRTLRTLLWGGAGAFVGLGIHFAANLNK